MQISPAVYEDLPDILALQKLAFQSEAELYEDFSIDPIQQTLQELQQDFQTHYFLKAVHDQKIVGSVRAALQPDGTCNIERLIVHPRFQNQGLGTALMQAVEQHFLSALRFELGTGHKSLKNLYLYQKLGYRPFQTKPVNASLTMVLMEKPNAK